MSEPRRPPCRGLGEPGGREGDAARRGHVRGDRYGKVEDPFGHDWSIATHQADLTPEQMMKAAEAAFGG